MQAKCQNPQQFRREMMTNGLIFAKALSWALAWVNAFAACGVFAVARDPVPSATQRTDGHL
jgi:hypothetical protein